MAYFSNHSTTSRFLANSTAQQQQQVPAPAPAATTTSKVASKHLSTSLNNGQRSKSKDSSENNSLSSTPKVHPLRNTYVRTFLIVHPNHHLNNSPPYLDGCFGSANNEHQGTRSLTMKRVSKRLLPLARCVSPFPIGNPI